MDLGLTLRTQDRQTILILLALAAAAMLAFHWQRRVWHGGFVAVDGPSSVDYRPLIDANRCAWPELCLLPGVGRVLAERIVAEREGGGEFLSPQDLTRVHGIGPARVERWRSLLFFPGDVPGDATVIGALE